MGTRSMITVALIGALLAVFAAPFRTQAFDIRHAHTLPSGTVRDASSPKIDLQPLAVGTPTTFHECEHSFGDAIPASGLIRRQA
jgi:hypothetical protein